jgi:putative redox protein
MPELIAPIGFPEPEAAPGTVVVAESGLGLYRQQLSDGTHHLVADEPTTVGGGGEGPGPYDLLLMSLGACTAMTLRMYANREGLPLERTIVRLRHSRVYATDSEACVTKPTMLDHIDRHIELWGPLDGAQAARLMEIADKCPVHRTLTSQIKITTHRTETQAPVAPVDGNV